MNSADRLSLNITLKISRQEVFASRKTLSP
jgi:hypothetical protein